MLNEIAEQLGARILLTMTLDDNIFYAEEAFDTLDVAHYFDPLHTTHPVRREYRGLS